MTDLKPVKTSAKPLKVPTSPVEETIFSSGNAHFDALVKDIDAAEKSIDLEVYIFTRDALGKRVVKALVEAAQRGVKVRVLVDGAGSPLWSASFSKILENAGAETRVFHPFPWQLWNLSRSRIKRPLLLKMIYLFLKVNSRNHRKTCIIDNKIAYIGSMNISLCHLDRESGGKNWRDTSVRLTGLDLSELVEAFEQGWSNHPIKERLRETFTRVGRNPIIRLNHTWYRRRILYKKLLRKISLCNKRIWITNAYFVPDNVLLKKLKDAASEGVDVRILLPRKADVLMMPWASSTFYYSLLKSGARIFEYLPSMLHAKSLILDDWALIGSSNLNHRSLLHDLEVDVNLTQEDSVKIMEQLFLEDLQHSREMSLSHWKRFGPRFHRFMGNLVLYLKFWI